MLELNVNAIKEKILGSQGKMTIHNEQWGFVTKKAVRLPSPSKSLMAGAFDPRLGE